MAFFPHLVEQSVDQRHQPRLHRRDVPLRQRTDDHPAHPRVEWRVVEDEAGRVVFEERRCAELRPEFLLLV